MPIRETPTVSDLLRASTAWVALVLFGVLTVTAVLPRTPLGYTPAPIRFVACGSFATVFGALVTCAFGSGFITVLLAQALFGRTMSFRARVMAVIVIGSLLFALSFGGALLFRRSTIGVGVCA